MRERSIASRTHATSTTAILLLGVLLTSVVSQEASSNALLGKKPSVELRTSNTVITLPCPPGGCSSFCPLTSDFRIPLAALTEGFHHAVYVYAVGAGRILGQGSRVTWDLSDVGPGLYTATVEVTEGKRRASSSVTVKMQLCMDCNPDCYGMCPTLSVMCYEQVKAGTPITCKALIVGARLNGITYQWSSRDSDDNDLSASMSKHGEYFSIPTKGLSGKAVITTVEVKGLDPSCGRTASSVTLVKP
ncbi:MAG TPA: hypothetical protein VNG71_18705 [Pyrinomonadaceae bacterium]|nr:hypothetical protein [Pyrinomonadaceae bacterium]